MKKLLAITVLITILSAAQAGFAAEKQQSFEEQFEETYGGTIKEKVAPRPIDKKAVQLSKEFAAGKNVQNPSLGKSGAILYTYGATIPRILCRPLRVTDIELEPGEVITNVPVIGDSVSWQILPSTSGAGSTLTFHVMVKPSMPDISTNLIVHTDRRSYHFDLVSSKNMYTPHVAFTYPMTENNDAEWGAFLSSVLKEREQQESKYELPNISITKSAPIASGINFNYAVEAKTKNIDWLPLRAYNDGKKTFIDFPNTLPTTEAPVFMLIRNGQREMVNYRLIENTYVIDYIVDKGVLIAGTGKTAKTVYINRQQNTVADKPISTSMTSKAAENIHEKKTEAIQKEIISQPDKEKTGTKPFLAFPLEILDAIDSVINPDGKDKPAETVQDGKKKEFTYADYIKELEQKKANSATKEEK